MKNLLAFEENQTQLEPSRITATRNDLQLGRRLFHMLGGLGLWTVYCFILTKEDIVTLLGILVGVFFITEQLRLNYPEYAQHFEAISSWFLRVEERFKTHASLPYIISCLIVIIIFPRPVALSALLILAIGDPIGAIVGLTYGKRMITKSKTLEGSIAMAACGAFTTLLVLSFTVGFGLKTIFISMIGGIAGAIAEVAPLRLDDNITIPIFSSLVIWSLMWSMGI